MKPFLFVLNATLLIELLLICGILAPIAITIPLWLYLITGAWLVFAYVRIAEWITGERILDGGFL